MTNQGRRRQSNQPLVWINQSMQLAVDRPWRYVATWAIGIGGANFGLGMLLNDRSMTDNARTATLYGIGCWVLARVYFMQHARRLRQIRPRYAATPAGPKQRGAPRWRSGIPVRRAAASRGRRSRRRWSCP